MRGFWVIVRELSVLVLGVLFFAYLRGEGLVVLFMVMLPCIFMYSWL